jgi:hypothetical protein
MLRNTCLAVLTGLTVAAASQAAVTITSTSVDTPGLAGFQTWTVTAASDGAPLQGFDFVGDPSAPVDPASSRGFFGPLNQLVPPGGLSTVWNDNNALIPILIPNANAQQDSQFMFTSGQLLVIPGSARENATSLQAAFSTSANFGTSVPLAQIVLPTGQSANFRGVAGTNDGMEFPVQGVVGMPVGDIAPVVTDAPGNFSGTAGAQFSHQFATSAGTPPITWEGLTKVSGPNSLNAPTLSPAGLFSWNAAQAQVGTFVWDVTARNTAGTDVGRISINIVIPEPATISLIGLAMVGLVGVFRRHR